ncbi:hypothetical protein CVV38_01265 [Candidatus Peregrinibacteria bacterium HGW-Peregrinibacteria-1]|jgi:hypothetical protein|nr:MAG: hypothetical protein CVV38_01265 [Candidatus Peregrinibacteria bacterium HGW-Peregrinibacteria-1]
MDQKKLDLSNRLYILTIVLVVLILASVSTQVVSSWKSFSGDYVRELSVEGTGKVSVSPDLATVSVGLETKGDVLSDLLTENSTKTNAIIAGIVALGVEEKDIMTQEYYVNPNYDYTPERGSFEDGYIVQQNLVIKVRDFSLLGQVTATATANGANRISGLGFTVENPEVAKAEAREKAIANAKEKAEEIAEQSGIRLGKIVNFWEVNDDYYMPYKGYGGVSMDMAVSSEGSVETPIMTGTQDITVSVSLSYKIK